MEELSGVGVLGLSHNPEVICSSILSSFSRAAKHETTTLVHVTLIPSEAMTYMYTMAFPSQGLYLMQCVWNQHT